jgi:hypothetical protein
VAKHLQGGTTSRTQDVAVLGQPCSAARLIDPSPAGMKKPCPNTCRVVRQAEQRQGWRQAEQRTLRGRCRPEATQNRGRGRVRHAMQRCRNRRCSLAGMQKQCSSTCRNKVRDQGADQKAAVVRRLRPCFVRKSWWPNTCRVIRTD